MVPVNYYLLRRVKIISLSYYSRRYCLDKLFAVAPFAGAWIETFPLEHVKKCQVAPFAGAWNVRKLESTITPKNEKCTPNPRSITERADPLIISVLRARLIDQSTPSFILMDTRGTVMLSIKLAVKETGACQSVGDECVFQKTTQKEALIQYSESMKVLKRNVIDVIRRFGRDLLDEESRRKMCEEFN